MGCECSGCCDAREQSPAFRIPWAAPPPPALIPPQRAPPPSPSLRIGWSPSLALPPSPPMPPRAPLPSPAPEPPPASPLDDLSAALHTSGAWLAAALPPLLRGPAEFVVLAATSRTGRGRAAAGGGGLASDEGPGATLVRLRAAGLLGLTLDDVLTSQRGMSWERTIAQTQRARRVAMLEAALRFLLAHASQPLVYCALLRAFWSELDDTQRVLARLVVAREAAYLVGLTLLTRLQPSVLLVDMPASWGEGAGMRGKVGVLLYSLAPEKMVLWALANVPTLSTGASALARAVGYATSLSDACAIGALVAAARSGIGAPAPLLVSYGMTSAAWATLALHVLRVTFRASSSRLLP